MSKFCVYCGEELISQARYCSRCGKIQTSKMVEHIGSGKIETRSDAKVEESKPNSIGDENRSTESAWKALSILAIIAIFLIVLLSKSGSNFSNSEDGSANQDAVQVESSEPSSGTAAIDCSKVTKNPSFSELEACPKLSKKLKSNSYSNSSNSNSTSANSTRSSQDVIRQGLIENCTNLPGDFESLRFQYRGQTFNNYGMPLDLFSLGSITVTLYDQDVSYRVGYADYYSLNTLNNWQCIIPFDVEKK